MRKASIVAFVCVQIASFAAATQFASLAFSQHAALGAHVIRVGETRLYWPWSIFIWAHDWRDAHPRTFAIGDAILVFGFVGGLIIAASINTGAAPRLKRHGQSGWACFDDVRAADLFATTGPVLGKFEDETLVYGGAGHLLLIGASRSGKGRGHVVPTLLAWTGSALVLDVKGELAAGDPRHGFPGTAGFRERLGPVLRFAPTRRGSARFNPLFEVRRGPNEVRDVQNVVEIIIDPNGDGRAEDFWDRIAKQVLVGLILHVLYTEADERKSLAVVREKLRDLDNQAQAMRAALHRVNPETGAPETHPEVRHAAESYLAGEERMRSSVKATAESFLGIFADPLVAANTAVSDFRVGDLMCCERPITLFLQPPPSDAQRLMPLMRLVLNQITRALMEDQTHDAAGRAKRHELLLVLDEFPQLGRLGFFETAMGAFAGYGLKAYLVCQSLNHITRAYGRDSVILDNCAVITAFAAADMETAKAIAAMTGERFELVESHSQSRPRPVIGQRGSTSYREERRPLMLAGDVRQLPAQEQLIFVAGAKPIRAKKLRFDAEPIFQARLCAATPAQPILSTQHDWIGVCAMTRPAQPAKIVAKPALATPPRPHIGAQIDLFPDESTTKSATPAHVAPARGTGL